MEQKSIGFTVLSSHTGDSCWLCLTLYNLEWPPIMTRCSIVAFASGVWGIVPPDLQGCCTPKKKKKCKLTMVKRRGVKNGSGRELVSFLTTTSAFAGTKTSISWVFTLQTLFHQLLHFSFRFL